MKAKLDWCLAVTWRGTLVCTARCSSVIAWDILQGLRDTFPHRPELPFTLIDLVNEPCSPYAARWGDETTGVMEWSLVAAEAGQ